MKTFNKMLGMLVILAALLLTQTAPAYAQRIITSTTLTPAISATTTTFVVGSLTNVAVGQFAFADSELMQVTAINTTAVSVTVQRGVGGTRAQAHAAAERIFITAGGDYRTTDPDYGAACTRGTGQAAVLPWINTRNGNVWSCLGNNSTWNGTNTMLLTYNSIQTGTGG